MKVRKSHKNMKCDKEKTSKMFYSHGRKWDFDAHICNNFQNDFLNYQNND